MRPPARGGVARGGSVAGWQGGSAHLLGERLVLRHEHMLGNVHEQLRLLEALECEALTRADLDDRLLGEGSHRLLHDEDRTLHVLLVHPLDVAARGVGSRTSGAQDGSAVRVLYTCSVCTLQLLLPQSFIRARPRGEADLDPTPHPDSAPSPRPHDTTPFLWRSSPLDRLDADLWVRWPEDIDLLGRIVALLHENSHLLP